MNRIWLPRLFNLPTIGLLLAYLLILSASYWIAFELRFDFSVTENYEAVRIETLWWVLLLKIALLLAFGQFETVLSYFRLPDALRLLMALSIVAVILVLSWYQFDGKEIAPRSVILSDLQLSFLGLTLFRLLFRIKASKDLSDWLAVQETQRVIIVGAGEVGAGLAADLMSKGRLGMRPVAFLDDDSKKVGRYVHNLMVVGRVDELASVASRYKATKVVVAFPSAPMKRIKEVVECAREAGLKVDRVPALTDLVSGKAQVSQLRPIEMEDLLGREAVDLNDDAIQALLQGKRVLVTGAGGSIGTELVEQVLERSPDKVLCLDHSELAVFNLQQRMFKLAKADPQIQTKVLDICDTRSLKLLLEDFKPEVIFHAAAHKHVNLMEDQPEQALQNNTLGTLDLARIASRMGVEYFVLISTDKAINPTSVMGASKRLAELAIVNQQAESGNQTRFISVRFGNVLGSSGSVIPIFRQQLAEGGPLTVTDPEVTRFFMTAQEAVGLVLQSATQGEGGEIFVLDMGKPIKILDVARQMIALAGMREGVDIEIEFTGLRPGEKRYEEVQHLSETLYATNHPRIMRFKGTKDAIEAAHDLESRIRDHLAEGHKVQIRELMHAMLPEYRRYSST